VPGLDLQPDHLQVVTQRLRAQKPDSWQPSWDRRGPSSDVSDRSGRRSLAALCKIPTKSPQPARKAARPAGRAKGRPGCTSGFLRTGPAARQPGGGGEVIELEYGITVYPAREGKRPLAYGGEGCWRCELWLARRPSSSV
jgi:hypothetical protein